MVGVTEWRNSSRQAQPPFRGLAVSAPPPFAEEHGRAAAATAVRWRQRIGIARRIVGVSRWLEWLATKITGGPKRSSKISRPVVLRRR